MGQKRMPLFEKGGPGGPGRPKSKPLIDWCKKWTHEKCEQYLAPIAEDCDHKQQLDAIKTILAYGIGKPIETVDSTHQFEGLEARPYQAKGFLGQLIAGETIASVSLGEGSRDGEDNESAMLPGPERGAGEGNP